ncbi:MAG: formate--tetrahydrofolate ligase [Candidatus Eisenbacteria bacterium]|jgi:formate--tetrahydrofolate ligase|nr:formate--tetrahydrofolate ligase [Candidatus Eisenbacteria bacterium]
MYATTSKARPIEEIAGLLGLNRDDLIPFGHDKAKVRMQAVSRILGAQQDPRCGCGKLVLVSAMTPTPAGEGKTTTSIGLTQAMRRIGKAATVCLREPSLGPCLGKKGGATGGGRAQVIPAHDINLHFTGDLHAVTTAHNLIAATIDNHIHFGNDLGFAPGEALWRRVLDMNDRSLREMVFGLGRVNHPIRQGGFDITAASEIMAALCLSLSYAELKERVGRMLVGFTTKGAPIILSQLGIRGAVVALLRDAMLPNLVQTLEGGPAFVHGGPFANIAQGTSSILATRLALATSDYVVTEAGFGFDLGAEKFFDIVCQYGKFAPCAVVLVATVRALKLHGGVPGKAVNQPNPEAVERGRPNLEKHIENIRKFGMRSVVALNRFPSDTDEELAVATRICAEAGEDSSVVTFFTDGGEGGLDLAEKVVTLMNAGACNYRPLYDWRLPVKDKIASVAKAMYGAEAVDYRPEAERALERIDKLGFSGLPVCIAKTQQSLSDNPELLGRPKDFLVTVRDIVVCSGAGFLVPLTGEIVRMPGLPRTPAAESIDIDDEGVISGLT